MTGSKSRIGAGTDAATDGVARVEIVTRGEVRREYTAEERARVLTEAALPGPRVLLVDGGPANAPVVQPEPSSRDGRADCVEVVLRNGRLLRVVSTADPGAIVRLAAALEA
jgi:hypothetical protein